MRRVLFALSVIGALAGIVAAFLSAIAQPPLPPAFTPARNPYPNGIYAEGIVESALPNGSNIDVFPEVAGVVKHIFVAEGQTVKKGEPLVLLDDSVQRGTTEQLRLQAEAAYALLQQLRALPRPESLAVAEAQVVSAQSVVKSAQDSYEKELAAFTLDPRAVSRNVLDSSRTALATAKANLEVSRRQRNLMRAGAWSYQIRNQERTYRAAHNAYLSANALLSKYTLRAPIDGRVLTISPAVGAFVSTLGTYDTYTQGMDPVLVLGASQQTLQVRCFVDEILVPRLPVGKPIQAQMSARGSNVRIPLQYVRIQPILTPKIQLSNQRQERVDVRVLPVIFRFVKPVDANLFPGQLVDVFISG